MFDNFVKADNLARLWNHLFPMTVDSSTGSYAYKHSISDREIFHTDEHTLNLIASLALRDMAERFSRSIILPMLGTPIYLHDTALSWERNTRSMATDIVLSSRIDVVSEAPVIYRYVEDISLIPMDVFYCDYCKGHTKNDMRGNCIACGAPRHKLERKY